MINKINITYVVDRFRGIKEHGCLMLVCKNEEEGIREGWVHAGRLARCLQERGEFVTQVDMEIPYCERNKDS